MRQWKVFVDMDGVVADFVRGAMRLHDRPWPYDVHRGDAAWDIMRIWEVEPANFYRNMGFEFWRRLPLTADADDLMEAITSRFGGQNVCFLSSPCRTDGCMDGKAAWVCRNYRTLPVMFSSSSHRQGESVPPKAFCAHAGSILIDDCSANVDAFVEAGGHGILVPRPWNRLEAESDRAVEVVIDEILEITERG